MSRIDSTLHRACRTKVGSGIRHPALSASAYREYFRAEPIERISMIKHGILASEAKQIMSDLALTQAVAMSALNISVASVNRRLEGRGRLPPAESERVLGVAGSSAWSRTSWRGPAIRRASTRPRGWHVG